MPNRFRPMAGRGDEAYLNIFSSFLLEIIKLNNEAKSLFKEMKIKEFNSFENLLKQEKTLFNNDKFTKL